MGKWWRSYKLKYKAEPVVLKTCGSAYVDFDGQPLAETVYICDEPLNHEGLHIDKVERKAWANPELRLRSTGYWMTGAALPVHGDLLDEEMI